MIKKSIRKEMDKVIKNIWLHNICTDYGNGFLIKEASLQCSLYHHLQNKLNLLLQQNHLYIYPEFYFKELKFFADLVIVEMDMTLEKKWLSEKMTDIAAIIESHEPPALLVVCCWPYGADVTFPPKGGLTNHCLVTLPPKGGSVSHCLVTGGRLKAALCYLAYSPSIWSSSYCSLMYFLIVSSFTLPTVSQ